jgi:hypothetical protein
VRSSGSQHHEEVPKDAHIKAQCLSLVSLSSCLDRFASATFKLGKLHLYVNFVVNSRTYCNNTFIQVMYVCDVSFVLLIL